MNAHTHMDDRLQEIREHILARVGGALTAESMQRLTADEVTLLAYCTLREEVMDGGLVQLIYNGYGPFIFLNPFAKAMRLWGLKDFSKLLYEGRKFYEAHGEEIQQEMSDEDFMALFEQYPEADDFDDAFIENEEDITRQVLDHALSIGLR
ncbi:MAG: DMP19 family protein [Bacteroidaceae bacterium]|nr:DMP19 family protein [Bacteroidaceae bacterium]MBR6819421.1 DMP19 family protein [Bacteroidaceae bacterium]MBR7052420.1 DMP19 family protein [Bacteroidaceae bacterium]